MKTIVFIGTQKSGSSREAIKAAQDLGYFTVLLTNKEKQLSQRQEYNDVHHMVYCDIDDIEGMKKRIQILKSEGFDILAIVSFVDSYVHTACILAEAFGVNHFTTHGVLQMENKLLSRQRLKHTNYTPKFTVLETNTVYTQEEINALLPAIIKSPQSTGSKDVYKVNNYNEFTKQLDKLRNKYPNQSVLIEEYIDGPQYLVEVLVIKGQIFIIGIVEQEINLINHHFIVTGYYLNINPPSSVYYQLKTAVSEIIYFHNLKNGACHLELRLTKGQWKLIEINPRISGMGMNQLIKAGYGVDLVRETLKLHLNQIVDIKPKYKHHAYIQYKTVLEDGIIKKVLGRKKAMQTKGVLQVYIKPRKGNVVSVPKSMGNRYAYVLATGENREEAESSAKTAIKEIEFLIEDVKK